MASNGPRQNNRYSPSVMFSFSLRLALLDVPLEELSTVRAKELPKALRKIIVDEKMAAFC